MSTIRELEDGSMQFTLEPEEWEKYLEWVKSKADSVAWEHDIEPDAVGDALCPKIIISLAGGGFDPLVEAECRGDQILISD